MSSPGVIGFSTFDTNPSPSPSVWADCPNTLLQDKGLGYFVHVDFMGNYSVPAATTTAPGIEHTATGTSVFGNAASATYGPNVLSAATGGSDNDHYQLYLEEFGQIVRNSGNKFWAEVRIAVGALNDSAFFFGLTTRANAVVSAGPIANDPSNSAVAGMTSASFIGFVSAQVASALKTITITYEKTTGSPVVVLADATNASAITAAGGTVANLVANTFVKLGIRFDGIKHLYFYINGIKVAGVEVDSTFDQSAYYVPVFATKTGTAAATTNYADFIRAGFQARS